MTERNLTVSEFLSKGNAVCADMILEENIFKKEMLLEAESADEYFDLSATANDNEYVIWLRQCSKHCFYSMQIPENVKFIWYEANGRCYFEGLPKL